MYDMCKAFVCCEKMEVNKKAWGTVILCKNSDSPNKRYDRQKSISINELGKKYSLEELCELFEIVIGYTKDFDLDTLKNKLEIVKNA